MLPTKLKPCFCKSFESASLSAVFAGTSARVLRLRVEWTASDEGPHVGVEAAEFFLDPEKRAGVFHGALDLEAVAHQAGIEEQLFETRRSEAGDLCGIEPANALR